MAKPIFSSPRTPIYVSFKNQVKVAIVVHGQSAIRRGVTRKICYPSFLCYGLSNSTAQTPSTSSRAHFLHLTKTELTERERINQPSSCNFHALLRQLLDPSLLRVSESRRVRRSY